MKPPFGYEVEASALQTGSGSRTITKGSLRNRQRLLSGTLGAGIDPCLYEGGRLMDMMVIPLKLVNTGRMAIHAAGTGQDFCYLAKHSPRPRSTIRNG